MNPGWKNQILTPPDHVDLAPPLVVNINHLGNGAAQSYLQRITADGARYIGRDMPAQGLVGSEWANTVKLAADTPEARSDAIRAFLTGLLMNPARSGIGSLAGRRLACWCAPKLCHGHGLVELVAATKFYGVKCPKCGGPTKSFLNWHAGLQSFREAWICQDFRKCEAWGDEARPIPSLLIASQPMLL